MRWPKEAEILQAAAVAVAAPRYMGAFAAAIGVNLILSWPWFATVEIITGGAMALLEGWAVAFLFRHWRRLRFRSTHWYILLGLQIALLLMLPATATPYLVASQRNETITVLLDPAAQWLWSLGLATIAPLIAAAIGYADAGSGTVAKPSQLEPTTSEPRFACQRCPARFTSQAALNGHQRAHRRG